MLFFQLQAQYDGDMETVKLRTQELEAEQKMLLEDKQLLTSGEEELKRKLQVVRKQIVDTKGNIPTEWH
jgi:hypothetical protein